MGWNVFALKLNKLKKFFVFLCYCCTCDGISVSRGKKSFVQVMFFPSLCVSSLPFILLSLLYKKPKPKEGGSGFTPWNDETKKSRQTRASEQKGKLLFAMAQMRGIWFFNLNLIQIFKNGWENEKKHKMINSPRHFLVLLFPLRHCCSSSSRQSFQAKSLQFPFHASFNFKVSSLFVILEKHKKKT